MPRFPLEPSYHNGFARGVEESAYPELWRGLFIAVVPGFSPGVVQALDLVGGNRLVLAGQSNSVTDVDVKGLHIQPVSSTTDWLTLVHGNVNVPTGQCTAIYGGNPCAGNYRYDGGFLHEATYIKGLPPGRPRWRFYINGVSEQAVASSVGYGTYQEYACVYDGAAVQGWVNGVKNGAPNAASGNMNDAGLSQVTIFNRNNRINGQGAGTAYCHHFMVWNRALTDYEMQFLAVFPLAPFQLKKIALGGVSAAVPKSGSGGIAVPSTVPAGTGNATSTLSGSGGITTPIVTVAGSGLSGKAATGGITWGAPTVAGTGNATSTMTGSGGITAPSLAAAGTGNATSTLTGSGGITTPIATPWGRGRRGDVIGDILGDEMVKA